MLTENVALKIRKMLVYTLTVNVEESVSADWLSWMKEEFLLPMMQTHSFERYNFFKVLHDTDGHTFTFQFFCKDLNSFEHFELNFKASLLKSLSDSFPGKVVYFNTLLEQMQL